MSATRQQSGHEAKSSREGKTLKSPHILRFFHIKRTLLMGGLASQAAIFATFGRSLNPERVIVDCTGSSPGLLTDGSRSPDSWHPRALPSIHPSPHEMGRVLVQRA